MWTRTYLVLLLVRLYFALSPSYIHPDENFQGPEVIAGMSARLATLEIESFTRTLVSGEGFWQAVDADFYGACMSLD